MKRLEENKWHIDHMNNPLVIDLFAGLKGWSAPFTDPWRSFTVDNNPDFECDLTADILELTPKDFPSDPTVILASPPCTWFSVMRIGRNWNKDHTPKTEKAEYGMKLVNHTLWLINELKPLYWVIENPRAKLRKLPMMKDLDRVTVTYCQYGENRMKPTDLWGGFPSTFIHRQPCKNGDPCHIAAPRGSKTGTQGTDSAISAKIPFELANDMRLAIEADMFRSRGLNRVWTPREYEEGRVLTDKLDEQWEASGRLF